MKINIDIPDWDKEKLRPMSKMPNCPICGQDELGMLSRNVIICYVCRLIIKNFREY